MLFELLNTFIGSHRPEHIDGDITKNIYAFGKAGFFKNDLLVLDRWASAIMNFGDKLSGIDKELKQ
jgi:hypothetical protein